MLSFTNRELLSLFLISEISKGFDPLAVLYGSDNDDREDDAVEEDFKYDSLKKKKVMKEKNFTDVELAICDQFNSFCLIRLDLIQSFQIKTRGKQGCKIHPNSRYDRFVKAGVEKRSLYTNLK
jgi:hypothetical protein